MRLLPDAVWLATDPVDMRTGIDGLSLYVQQALGRAPCDGTTYVFSNRRRTRIKVVSWDGTGVWMCLRRLHRDQVTWPRPGQACWEIGTEQWQWLVMGVDWQRLSVPLPAQWRLWRNRFACKRRRRSLHCQPMNLLDELARTDIDPAMLAQIRELFDAQQATLTQQQALLVEKDFKITALTHELAYLKRIRYGKASEVLSVEQRSLFDETVDADFAAIEEELENQIPAKRQRKRTGRQALPPELPRIKHRHELESCACGQCGAGLVNIGEDVSEQLDVEPARFFVHRHIRPQYACRACDTVTAHCDRWRPGSLAANI